ncbi:MAG: sialate O-acetylesterase [Clostridia bacterium]|nr:sialate O-acetylesterase [Clostridia bacterium]
MHLFGFYKDGMVIQRNKEILIIGEANELQNVSALIKNSSKTLASGCVSADAKGNFQVKLNALPEGGPYILEVTDGIDTITVSDVFIGELWLAAGQDNMKMPLKFTENAEEARKLIKNAKLHYYVVPTIESNNPNFAEVEKDTKWVRVDSNNSVEMSAIAYYFALELMTKIDCHIGIIACFEEQTNVASWQSVKSLKASPEGANYLKEWEDNSAGISEAGYRADLARYKKDKAAWHSEYAKASLRYPDYAYDEITELIGRFKSEYPFGEWSCRRPGGMFEQKIMRVAPMPIAGVIYYQGESDCEYHSDDYFGAFLSLIKEWRMVFKDDKLPFIYCQLHMWIDRERRFIGLEDFKWPKVRQAQYLAYKSTRNTYMAILSDCGQFENPNPVDKKTPGSRMAYLALKNIYGYKEVPATAPYLIDLRSINGGVEMSFAGDFSMLMIKGYGETGFEICGKDGQFYNCDASVDFDGKTVTCFSPYVLEPATVRYAYFSYGTATLSSDTGLAVLPFTRNVIKGLNDLY